MLSLPQIIKPHFPEVKGKQNHSSVLVKRQETDPALFSLQDVGEIPRGAPVYRPDHQLNRSCPGRSPSSRLLPACLSISRFARIVQTGLVLEETPSSGGRTQRSHGATKPFRLISENKSIFNAGHSRIRAA